MLERQVRDLACLLDEKGFPGDDDGLDAFARQTREAAFDVIGSASVDRQHPLADLRCNSPYSGQLSGMRRVRRIEQYADARQPGYGDRQQLEILLAQFSVIAGQAGHVSPRPRQARREAVGDRIGPYRHDDRNGGGRPLCRRGWGGPGPHDPVSLRWPKLGGQARKPPGLSVREARIDEVILSLDIPELAHSQVEGAVTASFQERLARSEIEKPETPHFSRLL